ncbi:GTPase HflX [Dyadobacter fanqingshengii]|uniref:GTPase HflX n=1 Tax=Dyadobacter fanqingshengii TaxID=2906443 RepID=A0A9X1PF52_9BACT|nr:GTPase HflX [Dyadobacter fanqingshengii]MCF0042974.1 GTPase HflX [Dyadobacter fanqingshengii]MCF2506966.1 GTPase HflX [Dyadobacter fanqingshengii]USJ35528.1 GTPase HflX [Dyadobacter fanqingshengii]
MIDKKKLYSTAEKQETAVLVAVSTQKQPAEKTKEYLEELAFLATTLGVETVKTFTQNLERADIRTYTGKGKLEEILIYVTANPVDMILYDDDLTPSQVRNLEAVFKDIKVIDRSLLILDIFAMRAQTAQSKLQVELAQYQYMYPRLTRMWTHLSRQSGVGVGMRGPGETELETDKRLVKDRIAFLKEKLEKIDRQSTTRRKERDRLVRVAIVGYTNVGKSTLMRGLSKAEVFAENKLFATVDSTVRKVNMENIPFLLTDTVGFIRKLPTLLIESFKSTLDEVREADILLHVVDISHPSFEEHLDVVNKTLEDIGAANKPTILVFNKIDLYNPTFNADNDEGQEIEQTESVLDQLRKSYIADKGDRVVFISAEKKENIEELRNTLFSMVKEKHFSIYPNWLDLGYTAVQAEE